MNLSNENIVHVKKDGIEYLQFRELLKYSDKLVHAYSLKPLQFSDKNEDAEKNYKKICDILGINYKKIIKSAQRHTDIVKDIKEFTNQKFEYVDGFITKAKDIALVTKYADCTPIIIYDNEKNIIGNIHSGWRGTLQRISQKAIWQMVDNYGSNPKDIIVCIGPCIKQCHFQVEEDFINKFKEEFGNVEKYYKYGEKEEGKQKYYFDTTSLIIDYLTEIGIKKENIFDSKICSVCNVDLMSSYRAEKENADRNMNIVMLIDEEEKA